MENPIANGDGYQPAYCEMLDQHLGRGMSLESFVGVVCEDLDDIKGWIKTYPAFARAYRIGEAKARLFFEDLGIRGMMGEYRGFNANTFRFMVEERFKMGKPESDNEKGGNAPRITLILPDNGRNGNQPRRLESKTLNAMVEEIE